MKPAEAFLYSVLGGFSLGVGWSSFFEVSPFVAIGVLFCSVVFLVCARRYSAASIVCTICALVCMSAVFGIARYALFNFTIGDSRLHSKVGVEGTFLGMVVAEPDRREERTLLTVRLREADNRALTEETKILVSVPAYPEYSYGDTLALSGILEMPKSFETDTGRLFDYPGYLSKERIFFQMFNPAVERVSSEDGAWLISSLLSLKQRFLTASAQTLPEPENGLLSGILFGEKHAIPSSLVEDFRRAGIVHIIVLSGYNITIIGETAAKAFLFLPGRVALLAPYVGFLSIILFVLMTGASATAVRSALMASLVLIARLTGRRYDASRALCIVGFLMVLHNPKLLMFDPSFQLSFLATFGLIHVSDVSTRLFWFVPARFGLREIVATTLATQMFVMPLLVYLAGTVSLVSPLANILVLPIIPTVMLVGFLTAFIGIFFSWLAVPFGYVSHVLLVYVVSVGEWLGRLSIGSFDIAGVSIGWVLCAYCALAVFLWSRRIFDNVRDA